jgi:hypothetical protein
MKLSKDVDLEKSLRVVLGPDAGPDIKKDSARQRRTAQEILTRFFAASSEERRELILLADEVGLGKTYVALAVAVSLLDAIRQGYASEDLAAYKPAVLILTPRSGALYNKWIREAETFKRDCAATPGSLDWLDIKTPRSESQRGNMIDLTTALRGATRSAPRLVISKFRFMGTSLDDKNDWRRRALDSVFMSWNIRVDERARWCRLALGSGSQQAVPELLDRRKGDELWEPTREICPDMALDYRKVLEDTAWKDEILQAFDARNEGRLKADLDKLTREALSRTWPTLPLIIIDEIHNLKNDGTKTRNALEDILEGSTSRLLGLSATPFQLRQDELVSVLGLQGLLKMSTERRQVMDGAISELSDAMTKAKGTGEALKKAWQALRPAQEEEVMAAWEQLVDAPRDAWPDIIGRIRTPQVAQAFKEVRVMAAHSKSVERHLRPFVIRHRRPSGYRQYWVGNNRPGHGDASNSFEWAPGAEVSRGGELAHYLLMRAVSLWKGGKGRAALGSELTGSYKHLTQTSATWKRFARGYGDPRLAQYHRALEGTIGKPEADQDHPKIKLTAEQALNAFRRGQKTLVFCVFVKTAEAVKEEIRRRIEISLNEIKVKIFGNLQSYENFRRRFASRREPLYALIQDHPLLGLLGSDRVGVPAGLRLGKNDLLRVAATLAEFGDAADLKKPDRRKILAVVEHTAVSIWGQSKEGEEWLGKCFADESSEFRKRMERLSWVRDRGNVMAYKCGDSEADPAPQSEETEEPEEPRGKPGGASKPSWWLRRLKSASIAVDISPYFQPALLRQPHGIDELPLLPRYHARQLALLDDETRKAAGQAFRRILMADEFLLRFLTDAHKKDETRWRSYIAERYIEPLHGQSESLRDRITEYLESLTRASHSASHLDSYRNASGNRNVVQIVKGGGGDRDRYFLGFNTPYRPEILVTTAVGQEGIDLHKECRNVIHHDLCWNPATLEQRTGRVDRIGSKYERERARLGGDVHLDVHVPYLGGTYDERMFEELYARQQLFELTMGGNFKVEGRVADPEADAARRKYAGIGSAEEDFDLDGELLESKLVPLPPGLTEELRVDLEVKK